MVGTGTRDKAWTEKKNVRKCKKKIEIKKKSNEIKTMRKKQKISLSFLFCFFFFKGNENYVKSTKQT